MKGEKKLKSTKLETEFEKKETDSTELYKPQTLPSYP